MPCNNKKSNCCKCKCKKPVLVILDSGYGGGNSADFLAALSGEQRKSNYWDFLAVDILGEFFISQVRDRLKCLCKKYGRKPSVVSAIFNSDVELQLARLSEFYDGLVYSGSSDWTLSRTLERATALPIARSISQTFFRSNEYYVDDDVDGSILSGSDTNSVYTTQVLSKKSKNKQSIHYKTIDNIEVCDDFSVFATELPEDYLEDQEFLNKSNKKLLLSDRAVVDLVRLWPRKKPGYATIIDKSTGLLTLRMHGRPDFKAQLDFDGFLIPIPRVTTYEKVDAFLLQAGMVTLDSQCNSACPVTLNRAAAAAKAVNLFGGKIC